jgi:hypothetical protein
LFILVLGSPGYHVLLEQNWILSVLWHHHTSFLQGLWIWCQNLLSPHIPHGDLQRRNHQVRGCRQNSCRLSGSCNSQEYFSSSSRILQHFCGLSARKCGK